MARLLHLLLFLWLAAAPPAAARAVLDSWTESACFCGGPAPWNSARAAPVQDQPPTPGDFGGGFVDGPNLYAYVHQNPWTKFDPEGLFDWGDVRDGAATVGFWIGRSVDSVVATLGGIASGEQQQEYQKHPLQIFETITRPSSEQSALRAQRQSELNDALSTLAVPEAKGGDKLVVKSEPEASSRPGMKPYEVDSYEGLGSRAKPGDALDHDHIPSLGALVEQFKVQYGRAPTAEEAAQLRDKGTAVAVPADKHRKNSPTYGGRNTLERRQGDAKNIREAVARDAQSMLEAAAEAVKGAAKDAAEEVKRRNSGNE